MYGIQYGTAIKTTGGGEGGTFPPMVTFIIWLFFTDEIPVAFFTYRSWRELGRCAG